ncbi:hypothetical protein ICE98_00183 [Lactococcus lactis]|nr:hypothetical protein [Lactococcus lactis]
MNDLRERINKSLQDVSVSSYETFKERLSDNGVILSERGQTFSYAFLDANNKQRRARETRLVLILERRPFYMSWKTEQDKTNLALLNNENQRLLRLSETLNKENQKLLAFEQAIEPRKSEARKRESKINRFIDTIKQFAGRVPELTQRVTRKLKQTKEKILDDFERRFSKDMKNYEQEQQKSLEKQANRDVQSEKNQQKDHDRGMSR